MTQTSKPLQGGPMTRPIGVGRLLRSCAGTTALEFALVAWPFIVLVFGILDFSRLVWTQSALQFAVEKAARCAAVNTTLCGTQALVQTYAGSQMLAPGVPDTNFSYCSAANTTSCGTQAQIQINTGPQILSPGAPNTIISYSVTTCAGSYVSATASFAFILGTFTPSTLTLKAQSCYPA